MVSIAGGTEEKAVRNGISGFRLPIRTEHSFGLMTMGAANGNSIVNDKIHQIQSVMTNYDRSLTLATKQPLERLDDQCDRHEADENDEKHPEIELFGISQFQRVMHVATSLGDPAVARFVLGPLKVVANDERAVEGVAGPL